MAAVVMPLPTELTTPPVMKMYLAVMYPQSEGASSPTKDDSGAGGGGQGFGGGSDELEVRSTRYEGAKPSTDARRAGWSGRTDERGANRRAGCSGRTDERGASRRDDPRERVRPGRTVTNG